MHSTRKPLFETEFVHQALRVIRAPDQVVELRVLDATVTIGNWPATWSGYFDDPARLVESLKAVRSATGVYITPNPVKPALLARASNRLRKAGKGTGTTDADILSRRWLLIDTDAHRPSGISANDAEHAAALERVRKIESFLADQGWPLPLVADSGNGGHLMYRVDLPADDEGLLQRCLEALAGRFDDEYVKIDKTVYNPARIWKLYGTLACKGDDITDRPHRLAKILIAPDATEVVSVKLLTQLAGQVPSSPPQAAIQRANGTAFDIEKFIAEHRLDVDGPHDWTGKQGAGRRWTFVRSPLCDHHDGAAFILQHAGGAITAECHHNSCSWAWRALRQRLEGADNTSPKMRIPKESRGYVNNVSASAPSAPQSCAPLEAYRPFPVEHLPSPVSDFIVEASSAIGCDPSFVALPTLACLARAIGNNRVVRLKPTWTEPAIIWAAIVGKSGTHKSPALKIATQILQRKQEDAIELHQEEITQYEIQRAEYDREYAHWKRGKSDDSPPWEPKAPCGRRFIVGDITVEALADRLAAQYDGVLVVRDELAGWINGIGEYKGGRKSSDTGHWLASWSAAPMTVDRKTGDRKTIYIPRAAVSLVGGIQPGILRSAIGREHLQDGLCARLLLTMPPPRLVRWSVDVPRDSKSLLHVYDRLLGLDSAVDGNGRPEPYPLDLTPEAMQAWSVYYDRHREEQLEMDDDLSAAWSKLEAYTARFSLIFQLCAWAAGDADDSAIDEVSMQNAIVVSDWFAGEARRVYGVMAETDEQSQRRELVELIGRKGGNVTARDLMRSSRHYPQSDIAEAALEDLVKSGWGRWEPVPPGDQGGKPTRRFRLVDTVDVDNTP